MATIKIRRKRLRAVLRRACKSTSPRYVRGFRCGGQEYWELAGLQMPNAIAGKIMLELERWLPYCIEIRAGEPQTKGE